MLKHLLKKLQSSPQQFEFLHSLNESIALLNFTRQIKHTFILSWFIENSKMEKVM